MIRPAEYWESQQATPGSFIFMEFPELEASGMAQVRSIEPCPPIAEGSGNVVTARIVTRQVSELVEIGFDDDENLTGTPQHPIWSIERQDWVELGDLEIGEHLWTEDGPVEVQSKRLLTTAESVYNLEVHGHHIYQVGELGVLVHNAGLKNCRVPKRQNVTVMHSSKKKAKDASRRTRQPRPPKQAPQAKKALDSWRKKWERWKEQEKYKKPEAHRDSPKHPNKHFHDTNKSTQPINRHHSYPER